MSCDRQYGIAGYPECSGNGKCINGFCICNNGWTSVGDYELLDGYDCDYNISGIKALAIAYIVLSFPALVIELYATYFAITTRTFRSKQKSYLLALVINVCGYILATLKLAGPTKYVVGRTLVLSINQAILVTAAFGTVSMYAIINISFLEQYFRRIGHSHSQRSRFIMRIWDILMKILPFFTFVCGLTILMFSNYEVGVENTHSTNSAFTILLLVVNLVYLSCVISITRMFLIEIQSAVHNGIHSTNNMNDGVERVKESALIVCFLFGSFFLPAIVLNLSCVAWKFMQRKAAYYVFVQLSYISLIAPFFIWKMESLGVKHAVKNVSTIGLSSKTNIVQIHPIV